MLFKSLEFVIYFPTVVALFFLIPARFRWALLLVASYYFYMRWRPEYATLLLISTCIDYAAGIGLGKASGTAARRAWLCLSLAGNLGILFAFKYWEFFSRSFAQLTGTETMPSSFDFVLPVGISFYTFQSLSYTIDLYRGQREPERHFGKFALYVSFFPQLVAGPIERSTHLLPQFSQVQRFDYARVVDGLALMAWGFFKKVVIADRFAIYAHEVFDNADAHSGWPIIVATYLFTFQIYADFSAYSDIAIGAARVMGFDIMRNFRRPYAAQSVGHYWRRWHISLSTWFRDYVFIPLGGSRVSMARTMFNLFMVFLLSGLWHGANWTYVIWGACHGVIVALEHGLARSRLAIRDRVRIAGWSGVYSAACMLITFHTIALLFIVFRAPSLSDAAYLIQHCWPASSTPVDLTGFDWVLSVALIGLMLTFEWRQGEDSPRTYLMRMRPVYRWPLVAALLLIAVLFGVYDQQAFIYFQF